MASRIEGAVPQQLRAQSGHYWAVSVVPVEFDSVGSQGESVIVPVDTGHHHQGMFIVIGYRIGRADRIPLRRVFFLSN